MSRSVHPGPVHVSGVEAACGLLWGAWTGDPQGRLPYSKHTGAGRWDAGLHPSAPPPPMSALLLSPGSRAPPRGVHTAGTVQGACTVPSSRHPCGCPAAGEPAQPLPNPDPLRFRSQEARLADTPHGLCSLGLWLVANLASSSDNSNFVGL